MTAFARIKAISLTLLFFVSTSTNAQTMETNIPGLVIKDYQCFSGTFLNYLRGNLINRNLQDFKGRLRVKIIDRENDILWQTTSTINVGGQNGTSWHIDVKVGNCLAPNKVQITLEP